MYDNAVLLGGLYGLHYTKIRFDLENQLIVIPLEENDSIKFGDLVKRVDDTGLRILNLYLVGKTKVDSKGITIGSETFPWDTNVKNKLSQGNYNLKVTLKGEWDISKGTQQSSFSVTNYKEIDLKKGYIINKKSGGIDVRS